MPNKSNSHFYPSRIQTDLMFKVKSYVKYSFIIKLFLNVNFSKLIRLAEQSVFDSKFRLASSLVIMLMLMLSQLYLNVMVSDFIWAKLLCLNSQSWVLRSSLKIGTQSVAELSCNTKCLCWLCDNIVSPQSTRERMKENRVEWRKRGYRGEGKMAM